MPALLSELPAESDYSPAVGESGVSKHRCQDLSSRSEIEVDLLSQLVLACGDVSLVNFVRLSGDAIAAVRRDLSSGCQIVGDIPAVTATLDRTRLAHLGCQVETLIDDPHITGVVEAEQAFWQDKEWLNRLDSFDPNYWLCAFDTDGSL